MIEFVYRNTKDYYQLLPQMREALINLADKTDVDWTVDELLEDIELDRLAVIRAGDDGFFLVNEHGEYLEIRVGAAFSGHCAKLDKYFSAMQKSALAAGFAGLSFASARKGWQRVARKHGFVPVAVTVTYVLPGENHV